MKTYGNAIKVLTSISIISMITAFIFKEYNNLSFCYDLSIGVFSGAILTLITSIIGYRVERKTTMENFSTYVKKHLDRLNHADRSMSIEQKVKFYANFTDLDLPDLGDAYSKINFIFDYCNENRDYIYYEIYKPIHLVENKIYEHSFHFRNYIANEGISDKIMEYYIEDIENMLFEVNEVEYDHDENGGVLIVTSTSNKLFRPIVEELNNKYFEIMYGKKTYKQELEREKEMNSKK